MNKKLKDTSFEENLNQLESIVNDLDSGEIDLEKSVELYQKGMEIKKICEARLKKVELQIKKIKLEKSFKLGEKRKESAKALVSNSAGVFSRKVTEITSLDGNVRVEVDDKKIVDANDIISTSDVNTAIASLDDLYASVQKRFTPAGQKLFNIEADRIMEGKKLTIEVITNLWKKSVNTKSWKNEKGEEVFKIEMAQEPLDSEVAASLSDGFSVVRERLTDSMAANIKNPSKDSTMQVINDINSFTRLQEALFKGISGTRTGIVDLTGLRTVYLIAGTPYKNPNNGDILYSDGKGGWLPNDPTRLKQ